LDHLVLPDFLENLDFPELREEMVDPAHPDQRDSRGIREISV